MKKFLGYIFTITMILSLFFCSQKKKETSPTDDSIQYLGTDKLLPINFKDTNYLDLILYAKDTITTDGWRIKYLVKDDNSKYNDLYIECSKGNCKVVFYGDGILQFRRYFIPEYVGETENFLFFTHACATDCLALLVITKDNSPTLIDYQRVYEYNLKLGQILYFTDETYSNEDKYFLVTLADLQRKKEYRITFDKVCTAVGKGSCIDTVIFDSNKVTVKATLRKSIESTDYMVETKTIEL